MVRFFDSSSWGYYEGFFSTAYFWISPSVKVKILKAEAKRLFNKFRDMFEFKLVGEKEGKCEVTNLHIILK